MQYVSPEFWNTRTSLYMGMQKFFHLYVDLKDSKLRTFPSKKRACADSGCGKEDFLSMQM